MIFETLKGSKERRKEVKKSRRKDLKDEGNKKKLRKLMENEEIMRKVNIRKQKEKKN